MKTTNIREPGVIVPHSTNRNHTFPFSRILRIFQQSALLNLMTASFFASLLGSLINDFEGCKILLFHITQCPRLIFDILDARLFNSLVMADLTGISKQLLTRGEIIMSRL